MLAAIALFQITYNNTSDNTPVTVMDIEVLIPFILSYKIPIEKKKSSEQHFKPVYVPGYIVSFYVS